MKSNGTLAHVLRQALPHALVILAFVILSAVYFSPVLKGKELPQMDNIHAQGASQELRQYEQQTGEKAQWTDSMFGGMPAFQIKSDPSSNIFNALTSFVRLRLPYTTMGILFLYMLGFYVSLLALGSDWKIAAAGAIAFAFGSYNIIIIAAGHITKCYAIAMMPVVMAGVWLAFRGKLAVGGILTLVGLGLELAYNHVQITYYLALALLLLFCMEIYWAVRQKSYASFGRSVAVLAIAVVLAILPSTANLLPTYEYGKYSIRGASELKQDSSEPHNSGLDKEYALSWSYGIHETPTLLVPNIVGGASTAIGSDLKAVRSANPQIRDAVAQQSAYWGGRSFTSGPVYVGAIICFLFFIGCFFYRGRLRTWLIAATILSILLAWGKNLPIITDLLFYHFPLYNKFRTVEMALVIATVSIPMLGLLGLRHIYENPEDIRYQPRKFFAALGLSAGVALLFAIAPTLFYSFLSDAEAQMFDQLRTQNSLYDTLRDSLIDARVELARADALRSVVLIILGSSALWFCSVGRINRNVMIATVALLSLIDLWNIDRRYLSDSNFVSKQQTQNNFRLSKADKIILSDDEPHRVIAAYTNPFNEVYTSYYHHSVGGYHGAKLRRYQDVIDHYLGGEWKALTEALKGQDYEALSKTLSSATAMNMLSTKYVIYNPDREPLVNPYAHPRAHFVSRAVGASSPDDAISLIGTEDLMTTAIVENVDVSTLHFDTDTTATLRQVSYQPDKIVYESNSQTDALAVFGEIYYPAGWTATIDDNQATILQTDYILRGLQIPAGRHRITFQFNPRSLAIGKTIAYIGSALAVIALLGALILVVKRKKENNE